MIGKQNQVSGFVLQLYRHLYIHARVFRQICMPQQCSRPKNREDEEYSDKKLENLLTQKTFSSSEEIMDDVKKSIDEFVAGESQSDDITLIVLHVT